MRKIRHLDISRLRELFTYDPITGELRRLTTRNAGKVAGTRFNTGHLQVSVDNKMTGVHRIAWALHSGEYPAIEVDHINGEGVFQVKRWSAKDKVWRVSVGHGRGKYYITHYQCFGQAVKHAHEMRAKLHHEFARAA